MGEIIDNEEVDKDTVGPEVLEELFSKKYKLLTETAVSSKCYINNLAGTRSLKLAVNQLDNSIEVYESRGAALSRVCRLSGHSQSLTELVFSPREEHLLYSAGRDGLLKLWDTRTKGSCVQEYKEDEEGEKRSYECMDVSCNGRVVCAGAALADGDACLVFWDQRAPRPLGGYWNSHTDDITQVKFDKDKSEVLASGSLDGLLNVYNIMEQSEEDALTYTLNVGNSVERLAWLPAGRVSCVTQSADLQLWDTATGDLSRSYARDKVATSVKRSKGDDCYLVDTYTSLDDTPVVLAGSNGGNGDVLRSVTITGKKLQPCTNFMENKQIVRCCWYDKVRDLLVTAGESGTVCLWAGEGNDAGAPRTVMKSLHKLHVSRRHKPY